MLEEYDSLNQTEKNKFKDCANELISYTFLCRDKEDNKEDYYFVLGHQSLFANFFSIIGYELTIKQDLGILKITNENNSNILRLSRDNTVLLLILRLLYSESMKETSLNNNIIVNVEDIQNKYNYLEIKQRLNKTDLVKALRLFRKYNLIEVIGLKDQLVANTKVILLPTLLLAVEVSNISAVNDQISNIIGEVEHEEA